MEKHEILDLADKLKAAKIMKKDLETELKDVNARIAALDMALSDAMAEADVERFSRDGFTFYLHSRLFASPAGGQKEALYEQLKENGYGGLVVETVHANTLASFVKEQMDLHNDEVPDWLKPYVTVYEKVSIGIRKGK